AVGSAQVHVTITPSPPVVTIAAPPAGTRVFVGTSVVFSGTATDATDGTLTPALRWTSDRDGAIGVGGSFATTRLSIGTHTVTAAATDAGGLTGHAERTVVVRPPNVPPAITIVAPAPQPSLLSCSPVLLGASPVRQAFLRFAVNGIGRFSVQQALLRLTVGSSSSDASALGGAVHAISNHAWPEATTTYRTRPLIDGPALAVKGRVLPKQAADFDVTSAVAADGTYDFAVDSTSSDWVRYGSREATS